MTIRPRFGKLPPLASGLLAKVTYDRVTLRPGPYESALGDFHLELDHFAYVERCFALRGFFEWRIAAIAAEVLSRGDVVFEGGAHIGTETFNYATLVGASGTVVSFEADQRLAGRLSAALGAAGLTQCSVRPVALGAEPGTASFDTVAESAVNSGIGALAPEDGPPKPGRTVVPVETFDATMSEFGAPRLVVMDIQGGEYGALRGATRMLSVARPIIVLEVEEQCLQPLGATAQDVLDLLREHGYSCWRFTRLGLREVDVPELNEWADWLAVPNEESEMVAKVKRAFMRGGLLPPRSSRSPLSQLRRA